MIFQLKHFIYLAITVTATMATVAAALPRVQPAQVSTRNITRTGTDIPVSTRYITTQTTRLNEGDKKTFVMNLCDQFKGKGLVANVLLYTNPKWGELKARVEYYIVDAVNKGIEDSLCSNNDKGKSDPGPSCTIDALTTTANTLYLVSANPVGPTATNFSIDVEIVAGKPSNGNLKETKTRKANVPFKHHLIKKTLPNELMTEIITLNKGTALEVGLVAYLTVTFCPDPKLTKFKISSTVTATNGASSFTQLMCNSKPCNQKTAFTRNIQQVPKNEVVFTPKTGGNLHYTVRVGCWSGPESKPSSGVYIGEFMYTAEIVPIQ